MRPPPNLTVSEWADAERRLSSEASAEPGVWRTSRTPYLKGIMDALNDPEVERIVLMSGAQVGKSEFLLNVAGYYMDVDPCPMLMLQPTLEMAEAFSKDRIAPMLRDTPALRGKVGDARSRDSGNTLLHKVFPGGHLTLAGANSPASLASRPIRVVLKDEVDRYPQSAGAEGDPSALADKRTATFYNRKLISVSTPTIKGRSRIEAEYLESDMRRFWVPCLHCDTYQTLQWANVRWPDGEPEKACYVCPHCGAETNDAQRVQMVRKGEWRAGAPFRGTAGFHINELYSAWSAMAKVVDAFLKAKPYPDRLKTWVNTTLGETWEEKGDQTDPEILEARAEPYALRTVPEGGMLLQGFVDVQKDRLELAVWAFGRGEEAWIVDTHVLQGDPDKEEVWDELLDYAGMPMEHDSGARLICPDYMIDSGGLSTQAVYRFCRANKTRSVEGYGAQKFHASKGMSSQSAPIIDTPSMVDVDVNGRKIKAGLKLQRIGSSMAKSLVYGRLKIEEGKGLIHFSGDLPPEFYQQLTAERLITRYVKGYPKLEWHKPDGAANEQLDMCAGAFAGAYRRGMGKFTDADWDSLARQIERMSPTHAEPEPERPKAKKYADNSFGDEDWNSRW